MSFVSLVFLNILLPIQASVFNRRFHFKVVRDTKLKNIKASLSTGVGSKDNYLSELYSLCGIFNSNRQGKGVNIYLRRFTV